MQTQGYYAHLVYDERNVRMYIICFYNIKSTPLIPMFSFDLKLNHIREYCITTTLQQI